jgi:hypothetical protein
MKSKADIGRLALRVEGDDWNAYYAKSGTMDGAIMLGSIKMNALRSEMIKRGFIDLMTEVASQLIKETLGHDVTSGPPQTAPEHERAGSA